MVESLGYEQATLGQMEWPEHHVTRADVSTLGLFPPSLSCHVEVNFNESSSTPAVHARSGHMVRQPYTKRCSGVRDPACQKQPPGYAWLRIVGRKPT
jgi:hypothetical protein